MVRGHDHCAARVVGRFLRFEQLTVGTLAWIAPATKLLYRKIVTKFCY